MSEKANVELMSGRSKPSKACSLVMIAFGLILCAGAFVASVVFPKMIDELIIDSGTLCKELSEESASADDKETYEDWLTPEKAINEDHVFYSWEEADAKAFALGDSSTAKVYQQGPYRWLKSTENYDVSFADGELTFRVAQIWKYEESDGLDPFVDTVLVESLGYQKLITTALSESVFIFNSMGCSTEQIQAIGDATSAALTPLATGNPPNFAELCDWTTEAPENGASLTLGACGCCLANAPTDGIPSVESAIGPLIPTSARICEQLITGNNVAGTAVEGDIATRSAGLLGLINNLARLDNSLIIDETTTPKKYTPAFNTVTVFQMAFGYPSALIGYFQVASPDTSPETVGVIAAYSDTLHARCFEYCKAGFEGIAAFYGSVSILPDGVNMQAMECSGETTEDGGSFPIWTGSMSCNPSASGFIAANIVKLAEDPSDPFTCLSGSVPPAAEVGGDFNLLAGGAAVPYYKPCCFGSGKTLTGTSARGWGCMAPIPGRISDTFYSDIAGAKAYRSFVQVDKSEAHTTGCEKGDEESAWERTLYDEKAEWPVWDVARTEADNLNLPSASDLKVWLGTIEADPTNAGNLIKYSPVTGLPGTQVKPEGLEGRSFAGAHLSDASVSTLKKFKLYETNSKLSLFVEAQEGASSVQEIPTVQYTLNKEGLWNTYEDNEDYGVGIINGYVPLMFTKETPIALAQPNFFNGATSFYDNLEIKEKQADTEPLTKAAVDEKIADYQTIFEVEKATGKTFKANQRLMVNTYHQKCALSLGENEAHCALAYANNALPESVFNVITPGMVGDVHVPLFRIDRNAEIDSEDADSFKSLEGLLQLLDIVGVVCALAGVLLGLCGIVRCLQG